jgi:hypothetical protein
VRTAARVSPKDVHGVVRADAWHLFGAIFVTTTFIGLRMWECVLHRSDVDLGK